MAVQIAERIEVGNNVIVCGQVTLDGSGASTIDLGEHLTTIVTAVVTNKRANTPALDPHLFTVSYTGATLSIWPWKPTGAGDVTMVASTDSDDVIDFVVIGKRN